MWSRPTCAFRDFLYDGGVLGSFRPVALARSPQEVFSVKRIQLKYDFLMPFVGLRPRKDLHLNGHALVVTALAL